MSYRGRILVIEETPRPETRVLWDGIRAEGWDVRAVPLDRTADETRDGHPDVVVLNLAATEGEVERTRYLDAAARMSLMRGTRRLPVIAVEDGHPTGERPFGIADVIRAPWSVGHVAARIGSLARLAVMRAEIWRRLETATRFGLSRPEADVVGPQDTPQDAHVLVVGAGIRYFTIERALAKRATLIGAFTIDTALDYLERRPFDAVVVNLPLEDAIDFIEVLRRNPDWYALPALVLTGEADPRLIESAHVAGATDLIFADENDRVLCDRVVSAMTEHRLRQTLKAAYAKTLAQATNDSLTGLYSRGFLMDHLAALIDDARDDETALTLVGLRVVELPELNAEWGWAGGDRILRQIGHMIARLVRGEDLAARAGGGRFAIALPATDAEDAALVAERIAGIVETTAFSVPGATGPIYVTLTVGTAELAPGEDVDGLYARAFA
jgi:diguanylate cyclase (GGDEF)-like protein